MSQFFQNLINREKMKLARIAGGSYTYTITRPDYSAIDGAGKVITKAQLFLEPCNNLLAYDKIPGTNCFIVTGNRNLFQPGDVIICSSTDIPTSTVAQDPDEQEPLLVKTPKICNFERNGTVTYTNVRFDYINVGGYKGSEAMGPPIPQVLEAQDRQIILYNRPNLREDDSFIDQGTLVPYSILKIDYVGMLTLITLAEPSRG